MLLVVDVVVSIVGVVRATEVIAAMRVGIHWDNWHYLRQDFGSASFAIVYSQIKLPYLLPMQCELAFMVVLAANGRVRIAVVHICP